MISKICPKPRFAVMTSSRRRNAAPTPPSAPAKRGERRHFAGLSEIGEVVYFQDIAERSLAKIGESFQTPFRFASEIATCANWKRNALTESSASLRCASPIYF